MVDGGIVTADEFCVVDVGEVGEQAGAEVEPVGWQFLEESVQYLY